MGIISNHGRKHEVHVTFPMASTLTPNVLVRYVVISQYIFEVFFQTLN
jgi:hypothetical protein